MSVLQNHPKATCGWMFIIPTRFDVLLILLQTYHTGQTGLGIVNLHWLSTYVERLLVGGKNILRTFGFPSNTTPTPTHTHLPYTAPCSVRTQAGPLHTHAHSAHTQRAHTARTHTARTYRAQTQRAPTPCTHSVHAQRAPTARTYRADIHNAHTESLHASTHFLFFFKKRKYCL